MHTRKQKLYRGDHPSFEIADQHVILVDDGFTPSSLIRDAIRLLQRQHPERITLALPAARLTPSVISRWRLMKW